MIYSRQELVQSRYLWSGTLEHLELVSALLSLPEIARFDSSVAWCDYILGDKHACPEEAFGPHHIAIRRKKGQEISRMQDNFSELGLETDMPHDDADPESLSSEWSL
jgi:hypothetical protein